ncbi:MAG: ribonuclease H-like domain-containing protein [bacterium]|nr:ribonuclease H-like domain-containing protein [bacterium]
MAELVLDLETKKSFDDVGGRTNFHLLEVSLVGIYDYAKDAYRSFLENELKDLEEMLRRADRVIGFNIKNFDYAVLQPHVSINLKALPTLDILEEVAKNLGHRVSLDSIASKTLGERKTGDGLKALRLYKEGKLKELAEYCLQDVKLTRMVYEYGARHGKLLFEDRFGEAREASVSWKKTPAHEAPLRLQL